MGRFSNYNWAGGFERVIVLYILLTIALVGLLSLQLYKYLREQDSVLAQGQSSKIREQVFLIIKTAILWVIGYKGEERERTRFNEVNVAWMDRYRTSIVLRFVPVYAIYILGLLVWTRPVLFDGHTYHTFRYSTDLSKLFILFVVYVASNIFFDFNSLRITFSHLERAQSTKRYGYYLSRNLITVFGLFIPSQLVSCALWIYKRETPSFPPLDGGYCTKSLRSHSGPTLL